VYDYILEVPLHVIHLFYFSNLCNTQMERDPTPLNSAAKVLINMQMETGDYPQQVRLYCYERCCGTCKFFNVVRSISSC
jgi:hypothetical protein